MILPKLRKWPNNIYIHLSESRQYSIWNYLSWQQLQKEIIRDFHKWGHGRGPWKSNWLVQLELTDCGSTDGFVMELWAMHTQNKWLVHRKASVQISSGRGFSFTSVTCVCVSRRPVMASNQVLHCFSMMGNGIGHQDSLPTQSQCSLEPEDCQGMPWGHWKKGKGTCGLFNSQTEKYIWISYIIGASHVITYNKKFHWMIWL